MLAPPPRPQRSHYRPNSSYNHYILNHHRPLSFASTMKPKDNDLARKSSSAMLKSKQSLASLSSDYTVTPDIDDCHTVPFINKCRMKVHAYSVPYMQAYESNQLNNDGFTELLLHRLNPTCGPSFYDYGNRPPQSVLDLGSGRGDWPRNAKKSWKNSRIVAFDIVKLDDFEDSGVEFKHGNFLDEKLPFPDCSFELVRLANLTLAIPSNKWAHVISEAHRVMTYGGRLEIIDDQLIFPYGKMPPPKSPLRSKRSAYSLARLSSSSGSSSDFDDYSSDDDTLETETDCFSAAPTLVDSDSSSFSSHEKLHELPELTVPVSEIPTPSVDVPPMPSWTEQVNRSLDLEAVFFRMLKERYGIYPKPSEFLPSLLQRVFGINHTATLQTTHLCLPQIDTLPSSLRPINNSAQIGGNSRLRKWMSIEWDKKEKKIPISSVPEGISAKAASRLGISYSTLAAASASTTVKRPSSSSSSLSSTGSPPPTGLVLCSSPSSSPSTFVYLTPAQLEAHATTHMQTLLGCKPALKEYACSFIDENGTSAVEPTVFEDWISDYEAFLRERFGWSPNMPDNFEETEETDTTWKRSSSEVAEFLNSLGDQDLLRVRTFTVFEGVKSLI